ncbi:ornithine cyclodeaminase family protein [Streptomyces antarcticus]|uniref:ornithine cyclodeaminase family protein n=1 Tax=Streptomyces antarcticus TaxID=2996458 RepID=UPI002271F781|nr:MULTISPECIES: ornithine cyclodeaminase family protein [unclassified Streptomyces]MCY0940791.1 ornithine cyclodeaminase family protein [Streptomyces sp. H34-AA3]MCZ4082989.1 ornithine cyclodeaminase family protein [Streptomyces sp. H34-S5]
MNGPGGAGLPQFGAEETARLITPAAAVDALAAALQDGPDPEGCPQRTSVAVPGGELLLMPAASAAYAGVKIAGVAPGNAARGLPRITGSYLLLDGPTLRPLALFDGAALTALRTPAVSALAVRHLAPAGRPLRLVLFGSGPQAYGHLDALLAVRELAGAVVVARDPAGARKLAAYARSLGTPARAGGPGDVAGADLVVCCTSSRAPLFDGTLVSPGATVVAVGSHEPTARETDTALVRRSAVYVESRAAALREAGDLLIPEAEGAIGPGHITGTLADLVAGRLPGGRAPGGQAPGGRAPGCPQLFKSVGMAWEDLAVAVALFQAAGANSAT